MHDRSSRRVSQRQHDILKFDRSHLILDTYILARLFSEGRTVLGDMMLSAFRLTVRVSAAVQRGCQCPALQSRRALHSSPVLWAGHNKWSKVKDIKIPKDAARARMIAKYTMMIRIAVRGECIRFDLKKGIIQSGTNQQVW